MRSNSSIFYLVLLTLLIALLIFKKTNHSKSDEPIVKTQKKKPNNTKEAPPHIDQVNLKKEPQDHLKESVKVESPRNPAKSKITLYSDPITNNKSYEWLVNIRYPEPEQYYSSKDELISGILDTYPGLMFKLIGEKNVSFMFFISYPNTDFEYILAASPTGSYIFQHGHLHKSIESQTFDKDSLFCVVRINYNPEVSPALKKSTLIKVKQIITPLTEYPGYKGIRFISNREDFEESRVIKFIDCLLPSHTETSKNFTNLRVLHISYSLGAHIFALNE